MALPQYTSQSLTTADSSFSGGLNTSGGALSLQDSEASNLQNIDFNRFGSVTKRNGYTALNSSAIASTPDIDGLHWYEFNSGGTLTRKMVAFAGAKFYSMDDLDGAWNDETNGQTITAGNHWSFVNYIDNVYMTNNKDVPLVWDGSTGTLTTMTVPADLTDAKYVTEFNNYVFLANVMVDSNRHNSRIYWSPIKNVGAWSALAFIDVAKDDGQEITGVKVLGDRLVIYKNRSIYNLFFTGDADIPFVLPNGGKSNSSVGCAVGYSIQNVKNGQVFLSYDGFYFYDGNNSYKISDRVNRTFLTMNTSRLDLARSCLNTNKSRYMCSIPSGSGVENDRVFVWDWYNNAWSLYVGMACSAMTTAYVNGYDEQPYFGNYGGFVYRADIGADDYPPDEDDTTTTKQTAINSIYTTNWRHFGDLVDKKGVPHVTIYYQNSNSTLNFSYSYDFEGDGGGLAEDDSNQYTQNVDLSTSTDQYGVGVYGTAVYAGTGGDVIRRDLIGRGRVIRFTFANNVLGDTFQIDGLGTMAHLESNA